MSAMGQIVPLELVGQLQKIGFHTRMKGLDEFTILVQQDNPGIVISAIFDQVVTDSLKQAIRILFPGNQFVYPPDGSQNLIKMGATLPFKRHSFKKMAMIANVGGALSL